MQLPCTTMKLGGYVKYERSHKKKKKKLFKALPEMTQVKACIFVCNNRCWDFLAFPENTYIPYPKPVSQSKMKCGTRGPYE